MSILEHLRNQTARPETIVLARALEGGYFDALAAWSVAACAPRVDEVDYRVRELAEALLADPRVYITISWTWCNVLNAYRISELRAWLIPE
jgi:hypothetical protein